MTRTPKKDQTSRKHARLGASDLMLIALAVFTAVLVALALSGVHRVDSLARSLDVATLTD